MTDEHECDCDDERSGIGPEGVRMLFDPDYVFTMIPPVVVEQLREEILHPKQSIYRRLTTVEDVSSEQPTEP